MTAKNVRELAMYVLGGVIVVSTVWILSLLTTKAMPPENKDALMLALGTLLASFTGVVGYFYGSSKGSADKSETLAKPTDAPPPPVA